MKIFGYTDEGRSAEDAEPLKLAEATLVATPTEFRTIAKFIEAAAKRIEAKGKSYDHEHLSDSFKKFNNSPQFIISKSKRVPVPKPPRKLSLVRLRKKWANTQSAQGLPFLNDMPLVYLGEIPNMPGHGVFAGHRSGRIYSGYHVDQFVELAESEV